MAIFLCCLYCISLKMICLLLSQWLNIQGLECAARPPVVVVDILEVEDAIACAEQDCHHVLGWHLHSKSQHTSAVDFHCRGLICLHRFL